jgi:hypothetical protein
LGEALGRITAQLDEAGLRYALVGGLAVSAVAEPRLTRDVGLAVSVSGDAGAERTIATLVTFGYRVQSLVEQTRVTRLATARLLPPDETQLVVDLLFASSGIEPEIVRAAKRLEILSGVRAPVAAIGHLLAMKLLSRDDRDRPQDADDLLALLAVASPVERRRAVAAIALIERRGFARGRDLRAAWDLLVENGSRKRTR